MSITLRKLFGNSFENSFRIIVLSEGYTNTELNQFHIDVNKLWSKFTNVYPFSLTKYFKNPFALYTHFSPSPFHGCTNSSTLGYNCYDTYIDSTSNQLVFNYTKIKNVLDNCIISEGLSEIQLSDFLVVDEINGSHLTNIVFVLLPEKGNLNAEVEYDEQGDYYIIASTMDGFVEQVLIRAIAKVLGLGDEFDMPGAEFESPTEEIGNLVNAYFPNLTYFPTSLGLPNPTFSEYFKWRQAFISTFNQTLVPIPHQGNISTEDRTLPNISTSFNHVKLVEGGAGYRTGIYRSAEDCILRRRIGDMSLPVKTQKVSLCPICKKIIENLVK